MNTADFKTKSLIKDWKCQKLMVIINFLIESL